MIYYRIIQHTQGCIKIEVPAIKKLSSLELLQISKLFSSINISEGIKDIKPNLFSGTILITYIPEKIDIIEYLNNIASSKDLQRLMGEHDYKR